MNKSCLLEISIMIPLSAFSFAISCDSFLPGGSADKCECKPNYVGDLCEGCGAGYFGQLDVIGTYLNKIVHTNDLLLFKTIKYF